MLMLAAKIASKVSDTFDILEDEWHTYEHININYVRISMWFHLNVCVFFPSGLGMFSSYSDSRNSF